ncbi:MAG TPA: DUF1064 domain-containing protein [Luteimonas sp.]
MSKGALRYQSPADMPSGMRKLHEQQTANPASAPGWVPGGAPGKRGSKYAAQPTEVDGIRFDSKAEARYYQQLKARVAAGELAYFLRQVPLHLPGRTRYVVDFVEFWADGRVRYVDVKGVETAMFRTKKRQVEALYPIKIEIEK